MPCRMPPSACTRVEVRVDGRAAVHGRRSKFHAPAPRRSRVSTSTSAAPTMIRRRRRAARCASRSLPARSYGRTGRQSAISPSETDFCPVGPPLSGATSPVRTPRRPPRHASMRCAQRRRSVPRSCSAHCSSGLAGDVRGAGGVGAGIVGRGIRIRAENGNVLQRTVERFGGDLRERSYRSRCPCPPRRWMRVYPPPSFSLSVALPTSTLLMPEPCIAMPMPTARTLPFPISRAGVLVRPSRCVSPHAFETRTGRARSSYSPARSRRASSSPSRRGCCASGASAKGSMSELARPARSRRTPRRRGPASRRSRGTRPKTCGWYIQRRYTNRYASALA